MPDTETATVTYNDIAELLDLCRQPDGPETEAWPTAATWCQSEYARDPDGNPTGPNDPDAASWCPFGRLEHTAYTDPDSGAPYYDESAVMAALYLLHDAMGLTTPLRMGTHIMAWSDQSERTPEQIAHAFDVAAAAARELGSQPIPL